MKILLASYRFPPHVGGVERVSEILAAEFHTLGHEVRVITAVQAAKSSGYPFPIIRNPTTTQLMETIRWCDVFFSNNISLNLAWPLLFIHRPWAVAHHTWISRIDGRLGWQDRMKLFLLRYACNIAISHALAEALPVSSVIIPEPYQYDIFKTTDGVRDRELIFVGRLVSDKGVDTLLSAMGVLKQRGVRAKLTIVGDGPEFGTLRVLVEQLGLADQVSFAGVIEGHKLAALLNQHRIMVVPSRWAEPFGIVALEGIACGCLVIGSEKGGLKDAIGPCGITVSNGDVPALAQALETALLDTTTYKRYTDMAPEHLARHHSNAVAMQYLKIFEGLVNG